MEDKLKARMEKIKSGCAVASEELQRWMQEDIATEARPAAISLEQAIMRLRECFMWANDAAAQTKHFEASLNKIEVMK